MIWTIRTICVNDGLTSGFWSQHSMINSSKPAGTSFGTMDLSFRSGRLPFLVNLATLVGSSLSKGTWRQTTSYATMAKEKTSALSVYAVPLSTSGAVQCFVPTPCVMAVSWKRARPKSASFKCGTTCSSGMGSSSIRLRLFRSRCMMGGSRLWRYSAAFAVSSRHFRRCGRQDNLMSQQLWRSSKSEPPAQNSRTSRSGMHFSTRPMKCKMLGWSTRLSTRSSRWTDWSMTPSRSSCMARISFTATVRPRSLPMNTVAVVPSPI
mmetsp:Transcript_20389/g.61460  ORF Transcript_20389/g.61460 Transcript_20389/m.61460 type:complete len:264 (+) Transcript_20389:256-1047(+)